MTSYSQNELILFYYHELDAQRHQQISRALQDGPVLLAQYHGLCADLDELKTLSVPAPPEDLVANIMQTVSGREHVPQSGASNTVSRVGRTLSKWINRWHEQTLASFILWGSTAAVILSMIFFLGRWSAVAPVADLADSGSEASSGLLTTAGSSKNDRDRVLATKLLAHFEMGGRLLTRVSNDIDRDTYEREARTDYVSELLAFNRIYRRIAERNKDQKLVILLEQMEKVLLELRHDDEASDLQRKDMRERIEDSDLMFKLRIGRKIIEEKYI